MVWKWTAIHWASGGDDERLNVAREREDNSTIYLCLTGRICRYVVMFRALNLFKMFAQKSDELISFVCQSTKCSAVIKWSVCHSFHRCIVDNLLCFFFLRPSACIRDSVVLITKIVSRNILTRFGVYMNVAQCAPESVEYFLLHKLSRHRFTIAYRIWKSRLRMANSFKCNYRVTTADECAHPLDFPWWISSIRFTSTVFFLYPISPCFASTIFVLCLAFPLNRCRLFLHQNCLRCNANSKLT